MKKYQIIGGQYEYCWHGEADTLQESKKIATKNIEFWDNWKGWHVPYIYRAADCKKIVCKGMITKCDGQTTIIPKRDAAPYAMKIDGQWVII